MMIKARIESICFKLSTIFRKEAIVIFRCKDCDDVCNNVSRAGVKKQHEYFKFGCDKCKTYTYYSVDQLKNKPKGFKQ